MIQTEGAIIDYGKGEKSVIGEDSIIRPFSVIYRNVKIGHHFHCGHNTLIREDNIIGNHVSIGTGTQIEPDNVIGDNTRIHSGCFLERTRIGKNVFIAPSVIFSDDKLPLIGCKDWKECNEHSVVGDYVVIGAGVVLLPGITIGERAFIAAGSVITRDVGAGEVVAGNPAKLIKYTKELKCKCGCTYI